MDWLGGGTLRALAPAKINLTLAVIGLRDDGYHELDSIVVRLDLADELWLRRRDDGELRLTVEGADCGDIEKNLVLRAARLVRQREGPSTAAFGAELRLLKRIPPGSGLGGGSSDAAATLLALNRLWGLQLPAGELRRMAAALGSDVPLFLGPPAARISARGERVAPAEVGPCAVLLCLPPLHCATPAVYAAYDRLRAERAHAARLLQPDLSGPAAAWGERLFNDLAEAAEAVCPELGRLRRDLSRALGRAVHVTGSGSGLFAVYDDRPQVQAALACLAPPLAGLCIAAGRRQ